MTRYSRHTLAAAIIQGGTAATKPLNVETGTVTLDDSWAPFIQGSIVATMPKTTVQNPPPPPVYTETRRNRALNPDHIGTGASAEYKTRFSWTNQPITGITDHPAGLTTARRTTQPSATPSAAAARGFDWYGNNQQAAPGTSGDWIAHPITTNVPITVSVWVRFSRLMVGSYPYLAVRAHNGAGAWVGSNVNITIGNPLPAPPAMGWVRLTGTITFTNPAATHIVGLCGISGTDTLEQGFFMDQTGILIEHGTTTVGTYFSGHTVSADPLIRYAFTGTVDASPSTQETGVQGPADPPYQVTDTTTLALLDPRLDSRIALALDERVGEGGTLADFDTDWGPGTLADLDTLWGGGTLADITATYFDPWNGDGVDGSRLWIDAGVRSRTIDHKAQTVTITFASDEAMMQDWALLATVSETPGSTSVRTAVAYALRKLGFTLDESASDGTVDDAAALEWFPGTSAWDYVQPLCQTVNLRLWCDESRVWRLDPRDELIPDRPGTVLSEFVEATDSIDRDGTWYDGVVVVFEWTDDADVRRLRRDIAGGTAAARVLTVNYATPYPGKGVAGRILKRMQRRGRVLNLGGVSAYTVYPSTGLTALPPDTVAQTGTIERVAFSFPEASMSITTRGLVDTGPAAWLLIPEGESWLSNPPGGTWTNEVIGA